jgi:hypothetical protein
MAPVLGQVGMQEVVRGLELELVRYKRPMIVLKALEPS